MNAKKFGVKAGALTYWSLGQETDPDKLETGLSQLGLPRFAPEPRTWLMALKAAMAKVFNRPEEMIRPLKKAKNNGYTVVIEEKGENANNYSHKVNCKVDDSGNVTVSSGFVSWDDEQRLQELTRHFKRVLPAASVGKMLTEIVVQHYGGCPMREHGGIYFCPETRYDDWVNVIAAVGNAACEGTSNDVSVVALEMNAMTLRDVRKAITREMVSETEAMQKELAENDLGERAIANRINRAEAQLARIEEYETLLGETLGVCRENVSAAVDALAAATAIQDDSDVFADVLAAAM